MKLKYIPNILSLLRIVMVVVFVFVFFSNYPDNCIWSAVIYMFACLTDVADGYLASNDASCVLWNKAAPVVLAYSALYFKGTDPALPWLFNDKTPECGCEK